MNKIIRFFNQNRIAFGICVCACIFVIVIIQYFNYLAREKRKERNSKNIVVKESEYDKVSEPIIYGKKVSEEKSDTYTKLIDKFLNYCLLGNYNMAYSLLSDDCKQIYYKSVDDFYQLYCKNKFDNTKKYSFQSWTSGKVNMYEIKIFEDILSTGKVEDQNYIVDYYTIINQDNEYKLNINNYIKHNDIDKEKIVEGININIKSEDIYKEYYVYTLKISNNTDKTICIDTKSKSDSVYISNKNGIKFMALLYENLTDDFIVESKQSKEIKIKFNIIYRDDLKITKMDFTDVIKDYNSYVDNKESYNQRINCSINIYE